ncbi:4-(cytidine 5'-diphospho)-2-C-methyl-D-erythritol kinase [Brevibacterium album]|uniref:4-(cytidine 5'-diphospho)-2-C-methyl-D-erythritol kinase n=1 Tax=Brevibacterium album TaxID=417948 RepID=UPI0003FADD7C|nr:4-(cytidine 5'-diphospho)-2-C-methyl-D-erythritol kinase [Brevibacterium album]
MTVSAIRPGADRTGRTAHGGARSATARAHGKINLHLGVGDAGADGYHQLVTVFAALGCAETVTLTEAAEDSVALTGRYAHAEVPLDGSNLALAAVQAFRERTGWDARVALTIDKQVPVAGGMGGGSADAAAALRAAAALAGFDDRGALHEIAATLGADVPFALRGGVALGRGRGDQLTPVLAQGTQHWVLATSTGALSTPLVYRRLDELRAERGTAAGGRAAGEGGAAAGAGASGTDGFRQLRLAEPTAVLAALASGSVEDLAAAVHNDMTQAAVTLLPDVAHVMEQGERAGALAVLLSGSGPTVGFLAQNATHALELAVLLEASRGVREVVRTTGPARGAHLVE